MFRSSFKRRLLYLVGLPTWVLAGFFLAQTLIIVVMWLLSQIGVPVDSFDPIILNSAGGAVIYALAVAIVFGVPWLVKKRVTTKKDLGLEGLPTWMDIAWAPAGLVAYFILTVLAAAFAMNFLPFVDYDQTQNTGFAGISAQWEYIAAFVSLVIIAPVAEELLFRGYLFGKLRKHAPLWLAIFVTSALFAFVHLQWSVAIDVFVLSIVMCLLRVVSGNLWPAILLHMLKNGIAYYFLFVNPTLLSTLGG